MCYVGLVESGLWDHGLYATWGWLSLACESMDCMPRGVGWVWLARAWTVRHVGLVESGLREHGLCATWGWLSLACESMDHAPRGVGWVWLARAWTVRHVAIHVFPWGQEQSVAHKCIPYGDSWETVISPCTLHMARYLGVVDRRGQCVWLICVLVMLTWNTRF